jgi:hypothetical protein
MITSLLRGIDGRICKMYVIYNGFGRPYLMPDWLVEGLKKYEYWLPSDSEWIIPGTYKE